MTFSDELTPIYFISKNLLSYKQNRLILDVLFRSRDVEKSGTGFQRVNEYCNQQNVQWSFRKEAYGFFFEFVRTNVQTVVQAENEISSSEQIVLDIIRINEGLSKA